MSAGLSIHVSSEARPENFEIDFFETRDWSTDAERQLIARIQEIFPLLRKLSKSFRIIVHVDVTDYEQAVFLLNKKLNLQVEVENQKLSIREIEILGLIMQGFTTNAIARKLFISYETVRSHRKHILQKTGAKNTNALITYYHQTFFEKPGGTEEQMNR